MPDESEDRLAKTALSIAAALAVASAGEKAQARRMNADGAPLFWREAARLSIPHWQEESWRLFTKLVSLMTPATRTTSVHAKLPLGAALAQSGYSEQRLARLIAARGPLREAALERAIRMMAGQIEGVSVIDLARTIFWPENSSLLARSYYQELDRSSREEDRHD